MSLRKVKTTHPRHRDYRAHRDYFAQDVQPVIPREVYPVDVELWPTNVVVRPSEKIILEVSSRDTQGYGFFHSRVPRKV